MKLLFDFGTVWGHQYNLKHQCEKMTVKTYHDIMYMRVIYAFLIYLVLLLCDSKQWDMALSSRRVRVMFVVQRSSLWSIRSLTTQKPLAVLGTQQFLLAIALMTSIERKTTSLRDGVQKRPRNGGPLGSTSWDVSFRGKETDMYSQSCTYLIMDSLFIKRYDKWI